MAYDAKYQLGRLRKKIVLLLSKEGYNRSAVSRITKRDGGQYFGFSVSFSVPLGQGTAKRYPPQEIYWEVLLSDRGKKSLLHFIGGDDKPYNKVLRYNINDYMRFFKKWLATDPKGRLSGRGDPAWYLGGHHKANPSGTEAMGGLFIAGLIGYAIGKRRY